MSITIKVACDQRTLADAQWLRQQVFVREEGRCAGQGQIPLIDRFDLIPPVAHIVAYEGDEPIAAIRVNADLGFGLPADAHFDFRPIVAGLVRRADHGPLRQPLIGAAGMLVVRKRWRHHRRVLLELYRHTAAVLRQWGVTHIVAAVSRKTLSLYDRLGFLPVAGRIWLEDFKDHVIPIVACADDCYRLAFGAPAGALPDAQAQPKSQAVGY